MAVDQLPGQVRGFGNYLSGLLTRLDQGAGWCAVFWQRDPDGMRACADGREVPPWDVVEAVLQDLSAAYGPATAHRERDLARPLHAAALTAYDTRPGGRDALADRLDIMLREQRYAADRLAQLGRALVTATTRDQADALRLDLAWARDDHERATARCAELRRRIQRLEHARTARPTEPRGERDPDLSAGSTPATDTAPDTAEERALSAGGADWVDGGGLGGGPGGGGRAVDAGDGQPGAGAGAGAGRGTGSGAGAVRGDGRAGGWSGADTGGAAVDRWAGPDAGGALADGRSRAGADAWSGAGVVRGEPGDGGVGGAGDGRWAGPDADTRPRAAADGRPDAGPHGQSSASAHGHPGPDAVSGNRWSGADAGGSSADERSGGRPRTRDGWSGGAPGPSDGWSARNRSAAPTDEWSGGTTGTPDGWSAPTSPGVDDWPGANARRAEGWTGEVAGGVSRFERRTGPGPDPRTDSTSPAVRHPTNPADTHVRDTTPVPETIRTPTHDPAPDPPHLPDTTPHPAKSPKPKKRRRGSARFAGMPDAEGEAVGVPEVAEAGDDDDPALPASQSVAQASVTPRGARFAGAPEEAEGAPVVRRLDDAAAQEITDSIRALVRLRREGRSGEAHALLAEMAHWPADRFPPLAAELERAGMAADWATLLWEAGSLPAERLVTAADVLAAAGRAADGEQILRQGVARPAEDIGRALAGLVGEGHRREVRVLLDAYVRIRTPEEAVRSAEADPERLVPLLLEAARGVSEDRYWDLVHALRVSGVGG
ncbi:hypothetical protein ACFRI7_36970 [Streptomyces sp. NPDC056716]|uniref:hypothetical protein n=1 Tax=unclassified Streptomyces TaxID=2593676 RepID=UPI0036A5C26A